MLLLRSTPLLLVLAVACSSGPAPDTVPDAGSSDQARARIENRASLDMDIYLRRSDGQSVRLGYVAGGETATFAITPALTAGASSIIFEARPVRRSGQPVTSEVFGLGVDEEIFWSIPPQ